MNIKFKNNMVRWCKVKEVLAKHGLNFMQTAIIDPSLPDGMHKVITHFDYHNINIDDEFTLQSIPELLQYLNGGRDAQIEQFNKEQGRI